MREIAEHTGGADANVGYDSKTAEKQHRRSDRATMSATEVLRALRPEQVVPRVEAKTTATSGSESFPVIVQVDKCEAQITPSTVVVRW